MLGMWESGGWNDDQGSAVMGIKWSKSIVEWTKGDTAFLSVVFTWDLLYAYQRALFLEMQGYKVVAGGPAVKLMPDVLRPVCEIGEHVSGALKRHNPDATFTSRGCVRRCPFCAVPKIEGALVELPDDQWQPARIVCDNNLLACSRKHFDRVIDRLKQVDGTIDFNQGLDARLLTSYHAGRLAELNCLVRLAFDSWEYAHDYVQAFETLRGAGVALHSIQTYVLINFRESMEDARARLEFVKDQGVLPNPMCYNPLDTLDRDIYLAPGWDKNELKKMMRYYSRLRFFRAIPYADFDLTM